MIARRTFFRTDFREQIVIWLGAASLYFFVAYTTIILTSNGRAIATVWPADAVLVALLLHQTRPRWGTVLSAGFIANAAANLLTRDTMLGPLLYGLSNMAGVVVAVMLQRKQLRDTDILASSANVLRFILVAGLLSPILSALAGAATAHFIFDEPFVPSLKTWAWSNSLGLLIFTPFLLALFKGDYARCIIQSSWKRRGEAMALFTAAALIAWFAFFVAQLPLLSALFAPLMLITFRLGRLGTKMAVMQIAIIGAIATIQHHGPIVALSTDPAEQARYLQGFLAMLLITCLPVAAEISARTNFTETLAEREKKMTLQATTDGLTGLLNRSAFQEKAVAALAVRGVSQLCLVAIDLDRFKMVNDQWGHQAGDQALMHLSLALRGHVRVGDVVGRMGGDEFMMLLPAADVRVAERICVRVRDALRKSPLILDDGTIVLLSISCGIAPARGYMHFDELAHEADIALYRAKSEGRNTVRFAQIA